MPERPRGAAAPRAWWNVVLSVLLAGCAEAPAPVSEQLLVWGTEARIDIVGKPPTPARQAVAAVAASWRRLEREWHPWQPGALVRINAALRRGERVAAPASVIALVERSRPLVEATRGLFDPAVGELVALWGFHTGDYPILGPPPDDATLDAWLGERPGLHELQVDGELLSVPPGSRVQLDFGAVGEGAALDIAREVLHAHGVRDALLTLGGEMLALGEAGGRPWRVAIRDPFAAGDAPLAELALHDGEGLFVSGGYARYRETPGGGRWPHVLDPRTARPAQGTVMVAVVAGDPVLADAAATALMIAGPEGFADLLDRLDLHCAMLLGEDGALRITGALQRRLDWRRQPLPATVLPGTDGDCLRR